MDIRVEGAEKLDAVGRKLKQIGDKDLKKNLTAKLRATAGPLVNEVRASAEATLPHHGGLNRLVAGSKIGVSNRLTGQKVGVRITARNPGHDIRNLDKGRLRHPVFGNRNVWVTQTIEPGWFSHPLLHSANRVRTAILGVIDDAARSLDG